MSGPPGRTVPQIQLLVVQPTPFCNIDCRYCYLPDRSSKAVVADETLAELALVGQHPPKLRWVPLSLMSRVAREELQAASLPQQRLTTAALPNSRQK